MSFFFITDIKFGGRQKDVPPIVHSARPKARLEVSDVMPHFLEVGRQLNAQNRITVSPATFADFLVVVTYCETSWRVSAESHGQNGLIQFTPETRAALDIPNLKGVPVADQVPYLVRYYMELGRKLRMVKSPSDLHAFTFSPSRAAKTDTLSRAAVQPNLDTDKDGWIVKAELAQFQNRRTSENKAVWNILQKYLP